MAAERDPGRSLVVGAVERMPIVDRSKLFHAMDQSTVCTVETHDVSGAKRGAIAIGISRHDHEFGFAVYSSIEEAEATIALIQLAIDDAKRIEAGQLALAPEGAERSRKH